MGYNITNIPYISMSKEYFGISLCFILIMKIDPALRPFLKKSFFVDLPGYPFTKELIRDLKLLGAKHEPTFSKHVSFVVSNRTPLKANPPASWNQDFLNWYPLTPKSSTICPSPQLLSDISLDYLDSTPYVNSPATDQNSTPMSRGMTLLKKASSKNQSGKDLLEKCEKWNVKIYHVEKIRSRVLKYKNVITARYAAEFVLNKSCHSTPTDKPELIGKKAKKENSSTEKKLQAPFIKYEDDKRQYKPIYQEFTSWTNVIDNTLCSKINEIYRLFKRTGDIKYVTRPVLSEVNMNSSNQPFQNSSQSSKTKSFTKVPSSLNASNSFQASTVLYTVDKVNSLHTLKRPLQIRPKSLYCEICHKKYVNLNEHINTEKHQTFMNDPINFLPVQNVIASLPVRGDILLSKSYLDEDNAIMSFPFSFCNEIDPGLSQISHYNSLGTEVIEPCYFLEEATLVSPSCSSDSQPMPFLHDSSVDQHKQSVEQNENKNNDLIFSVAKSLGEIRNPTLLQNTCLRNTENIPLLCDSAVDKWEQIVQPCGKENNLFEVKSLEKRNNAVLEQNLCLESDKNTILCDESMNNIQNIASVSRIPTNNVSIYRSQRELFYTNVTDNTNACDMSNMMVNDLQNLPADTEKDVIRHFYTSDKIIPNIIDYNPTVETENKCIEKITDSFFKESRQLPTSSTDIIKMNDFGNDFGLAELDCFLRYQGNYFKNLENDFKFISGALIKIKDIHPTLKYTDNGTSIQNNQKINFVDKDYNSPYVNDNYAITDIISRQDNFPSENILYTKDDSFTFRKSCIIRISNGKKNLLPFTSNSTCKSNSSNGSSPLKRKAEDSSECCFEKNQMLVTNYITDKNCSSERKKQKITFCLESNKDSIECNDDKTSTDDVCTSVTSRSSDGIFTTLLKDDECIYFSDNQDSIIKDLYAVFASKIYKMSSEIVNIDNCIRKEKKSNIVSKRTDENFFVIINK
ncbi:uncharacterized protein CEXT_251241 [Caerostris extrusa]|uniref:DBF4-type domain-containing protein n=1 Tax=Caerostris extrusa TaxID=172846 RepID=A0AAV4VXS4_CAEEX|nr:uncharacterized protein CEXT_251241 [Caerostris extrusa]